MLKKQRRDYSKNEAVNVGFWYTDVSKRPPVRMILMSRKESVVYIRILLINV